MIQLFEVQNTYSLVFEGGNNYVYYVYVLFYICAFMKYVNILQLYKNS